MQATHAPASSEGTPSEGIVGAERVVVLMAQQHSIWTWSALISTAIGASAAATHASSQTETQLAEPAVEPASPEGEALPSALDLFARHAELVGGEAGFEDHETRIMTGVVRGSMGASFMTAYYEKPNRMALIMEPIGGDKLTRVFDGEFAWEVIGDSGEVSMLRGAELLEFVESSDFMGEVNYKNRYRTVQTIGTEEIDGRPTYRVATESRLGRRGLMFFDQETGYLVAALTPQLIQGQVFDMQTRLLDYQPVGDIELPRKIMQTVLKTPFESEISIRSIETGVDRSELFERSEAVQAAIDAANAAMEAARSSQEDAGASDDG
ncbi:MAG: hypothetical protein AAGK04_06925 [Planctomycetota bacterium]